jgi:PAS domain S-box-containing protein
MNAFFNFLLCLIVACGTLANGAATERLTVSVGVSAQDPLVVIGSDGKTVEGFAVEVLDHIAALKGWQIRYVPDTLANNLKRVEQGELDLVMPVPWPSRLSNRVDINRQGILVSWGRIYVTHANRILVLQDISGTSIAVVRGDPHYDRLKGLLNEAGVRCQFVEMQRYAQILEALDRRQVDGGLVDAYYGERFSRKYNVKASPVVTPTIDFRLVAQGNQKAALIEGLDYWLGVLRTNYRSPYYKALTKWVLPDRHFAIVFGGGMVLGLIMLAGGWFAVRRIHRTVEKRMALLRAKSDELKKILDDEVERKKAIAVWKDWYGTLFNHSNDAILVYGIDSKEQPGKFVEANDTACRMLGYTRAELLALAPQDVEVGGDRSRPIHMALLDRKHGAPASSEVVIERTIRKRSGVEIPVEVTIRLLNFEGRPVVMCAAHDISMRRDALQALKESERRFQDFFARSPIGVAVYDANQQLTDVNQAALAMFGFSERSLFSRLNMFAIPELTLASRDILLKGGTVRFEWTVNFDEFRRDDKFHSSRSGRCRFDVLATNLGLDHNFNPKGFLVQIQDISERRRAEEALMQNEKVLRQAQKMEAIGTLAGGIAHDFNNILTPIIGYAEMALLVSEAYPSIRSHLEEILKASRRAKELVRQILAFSRQAENEAKPVKLSAIVSEVCALLHGSIPSNVELRWNTRMDRDIVQADPIQLHQVVMNLCANALHAMRDHGGVLELTQELVTIDSRTHGQLSRLRRGEYVDLSVRDTGIGMTRETMDRIFEPFFTTKRSGEGTGMGLAVVHGIVKSLNGLVHVESELGKGTIFHVVLPLVAQTTDVLAVALEPLPRGTETILFVDDEGDIVTMVEQMLMGLGYAPVVCRGSREALALFKTDPGAYDMVITDQMMPGMTGSEMVREMHKLRSDLPVIICTGFSKTVPESELAESGVGEVVMKPILLRQMAESIRRVLKHGVKA